MLKHLSVFLVALMSPVGCNRPDDSGRTKAPITGATTPAAAATARAAYSRLTALRGHWIGRSVGYPASADISLTAKGTALIEKIIVEDPVEMLSVYHFDGPRLVLDHYCAAGNQPRLFLTSESTPERLVFSIDTVTNLTDQNAMHMRQLIVDFSGSGVVTWTWSNYHQGKHAEDLAIVLQR